MCVCVCVCVCARARACDECAGGSTRYAIISFGTIYYCVGLQIST